MNDNSLIDSLNEPGQYVTRTDFERLDEALKEAFGEGVESGFARLQQVKHIADAVVDDEQLDEAGASLALSSWQRPAAVWGWRLCGRLSQPTAAR